MRELPCIFKTKDWWTYEFCHGRYLKQYHVENDKVVGVNILLGLFQKEEEDGQQPNRQMKHFSQWYNNGSRYCYAIVLL